MPLTSQQIQELNRASARIAAGQAGAASATNAGDVANVAYAQKRYGYTYSPPVVPPTPTTTPTITPTPPPTTTPVKPARYNLDLGETVAEKAQREYYEGLPRNTAIDEAAIREQTRQRMQAQIDAINQVYSGLLAKEQQAGVGRLGVARAVGARAGLLGSDIYELGQKPQTEAYNLASEKAIEAERGAKVAAVWGEIDKAAQEAITAKKQEVMGNAQAYVNYLTSNQDKAISRVGTLAKSGQKLDEITDDDFKKLLEQTGFSGKELELYWNANKPTNQKSDYEFQKVDNNVYVWEKTADGTLKRRTDLDISTPTGTTGEYDIKISTDGKAYLFPKKIDPTKSLDDQVIKYGSAGTFDKVGGSDSSSLTKDEKAFYEDIDNQINKLNTGKISWGEAFNFIKAKWNAPDSIIDNLLNKSFWGQAGAYERQQAERAKTKSAPVIIQTQIE